VIAEDVTEAIVGGGGMESRAALLSDPASDQESQRDPIGSTARAGEGR